MNVAVVGTGYVGLVTGVCLAAVGHKVSCVDIQPERIHMINRAEAPFFEPGLDKLLQSALAAGLLEATTDLSAAVLRSDVVLVAVGTPSTNAKIDLSAMQTALRSIGEVLKTDDRYRTVVIKSTVVPSTTDTFAKPILEQSSGKSAGSDFGLAMNPEFLREGCAIDDFQEPDRIIFGEIDARTGAAMEELYAPFSCAKIHTSLRNAELIKYTSNALLATLISFSNEIASICEAVEGTDIETVMDGLHLDKRLSPVVDGTRIVPAILIYLRAGAGFGGSCLPKDVAALRNFCADHAVQTPLLDAVMDVNVRRPDKLVDIIREEVGALSGKTISILGLAFKAGTDDLRESASLRAIDLLLEEGARVRAYDPIAFQFQRNQVDSRIAEARDPQSIVKDADAVVLMTAWPEFQTWDWPGLVKQMKSPTIIDGRNAFRKIKWPDGVKYRGVGTATRAPEVARLG